MKFRRHYKKQNKNVVENYPHNDDRWPDVPTFRPKMKERLASFDRNQIGDSHDTSISAGVSDYFFRGAGRIKSSLKRVENFFKGILRLGQTYRRAQLADRRLRMVVGPRLSALEEKTEHLSRLEARLDRIENNLERAGDQVKQHAEVVADLQNVSQLSQQLSTKMGAMEGSLERVSSRIDQHEEALSDLPNVSQLFQQLSTKIGAIENNLKQINNASEARHSDVVELRKFAAQLHGKTDGLSAKFSELNDTLITISNKIGDALNYSERNSARVSELADKLSELDANLNETVAENAIISRSFTDLTRRIDLVKYREGTVPPEQILGVPPAQPSGIEALMNAFYARLEDRFRGSREEIMRRLEVYLPDARDAYERTGGKPILDIGCGRGEWVELLTVHGLPAEGVDLNPVQIAEAPAELALTEGDALAHMADRPDNSLSLISAHHVIEHLHFDRVLAITREALRLLAPGGVLIYETPNPKNVIVGAATFHIDPTHLQPWPAEKIAVLMETVGFEQVETRNFNPSDLLPDVVRRDKTDEHVAYWLFGPQDLAVIARRI
jgi:O-antigen chain-terminating methyltransferase